MPDTKKYDMGYGPKTYWVYGNQLTKVNATVKGETRRVMAEAGLDGDEVALTDRHAFDVSLTDEEKNRRSRMHPSLMSGEFLPDYERGEVEIARVAYASVTGDVVSIRARWNEGRICYSVVDEYIDEYGPCETQLQETNQPLTLAQLIHLVDTAQGNFSEEGDLGLVFPVLEMNFEGGMFKDALSGFVTVSSPFYPELEAWYVDVVDEWISREDSDEEESQQSGGL